MAEDCSDLSRARNVLVVPTLTVPPFVPFEIVVVVLMGGVSHHL